MDSVFPVSLQVAVLAVVLVAAGVHSVLYVAKVPGDAALHDSSIDTDADFIRYKLGDLEKTLEKVDNEFVHIFHNIIWVLHRACDYVDGHKSGTVFGIISAFSVSSMLMIFFHIMHTSNTCTSQTWKKIGFKTEREHKVSSCESPSAPTKFLRYYWNSQSSSALIGAAVYILTRLSLDNEVRGKYACALVSIILFFIGLVSYAWWGSKTQEAWSADNVLMEIMIASLGLMFPAVLWPNLEFYFVSTFAAAIIGLTITKYGSGANLYVAMLVPYLSGLFSTFQCKVHGDYNLMVLSFVLTLFGYVPKLADIYDGFRWGTTFFHVIESLAWVVLFEWSQTLPRNC